MWFFHHHWSHWTHWRVLLASPLWSSNNLFSMPIMLSFLFQSWASHKFSFMLVFVMVFAVCIQAPKWSPFSPIGAQPFGLCITTTLWRMPMAGIYASWCWFVAHSRDALSSCFELGVSHATQTAVLQPFNQYGRAHSFGSSEESQLIPPSSPHGRKGSSFPGLVPSYDTLDSKSVVGFNMVIPI